LGDYLRQVGGEKRGFKAFLLFGVFYSFFQIYITKVYNFLTSCRFSFSPGACGCQVRAGGEEVLFLSRGSWNLLVQYWVLKWMSRAFREKRSNSQFMVMLEIIID
jgi:hypothetical protein